MPASQSPFKFLDSFKNGEKDSFFGRDEEIDVIYNYLHESNYVLVNGPSGTGKSSIVQCGLASRFERADWLEVFVRRHENINDSLNEKINEINIEDCPHQENIIKTLKSLYLDFFKPIYLIFDQFEELFILGNAEEKELFFNNLRKIIDDKEIPCKVVLIMREKYIAQLQKYEYIIPEIFDKRVRVEQMTDDNIKYVILSTCKKFGIVDANQKELQTETIDEIVKNLKIEDNLIELPHLQIYLDRLWKEGNLSETNKVFSVDLVKKVGNIQVVLKKFLEERIEVVHTQVVELYPNVQKNDVRQLLWNFTNEEGSKKSRKRGDVFSKNIDKETTYFIIDSFVNQEVLRLEKSDEQNPDNNIYEITHDTLANIIHSQLFAENTQVLRAVKIIKEGYNDYNVVKTFYFNRSFLDKNQLQEIALMENKILNNIPETDQPTKEQWRIVEISKQHFRIIRGIYLLIPILIVSLMLFYIGKIALERNSKFELLIEELASSPTQKYLLYKEYERQSTVPKQFRTNNSEVLNEIKNLPQKENLYYLTLINDEPIFDIKYLDGSKRQYFVVSGDKSITIYDAKTGAKKAHIDPNKLETVTIDGINTKFDIIYKDSIISQDRVKVTDSLGQNEPIKVFFRKKSYDISKRNTTSNNGGYVLEDIDNNFTSNQIFYRNGIYKIDSTQFEYDPGKEHNYSFYKSYNDKNLFIVSDNEHGICRIFKTIKTIDDNESINLTLLPEEKLRFHLELTDEDYNHLTTSTNSDTQKKIWRLLENDLVANSGFFKKIFNPDRTNIAQQNLERLIKTIIGKTDYKNLYALWTNIYRKIDIYKNDELRTFYQVQIKQIEKKAMSFSDNDRFSLFKAVRLQSRQGATDEHIVFLENMQKQDSANVCLKVLLSIVYNNACWYKLLERDYKKSIAYGQKGLKISLPKEQLNYIYTNLAHGYLCDNQVQKADSIYQKFAPYKSYDEADCQYIESSQYIGEVMEGDLGDLLKDNVIPKNLIKDAISIQNTLNKK